MNVFNLTGEAEFDGFMLPGYESNHPPYYIDMPFAFASNLSLTAIASILRACLFTMKSDKRFNAYDKYCYIIVTLCVPHLIVANMLSAVMQIFDVYPLVYIYDRLHGLNPLSNIMDVLEYKEAYDNIHCTDWKKDVNSSNNILENKEVTE
jgi:hypothetical protein